jgi:hypothetical protein
MRAIVTAQQRHRSIPRREAGVAAVEFALVLPLILFLLMGVVDISRALQANLILVNLSRETANLTERGPLPLDGSSQTIIGSVAASAPPLDMNHLGMIYITKILGKGIGKGGVVLEQYRWDDSVNQRGYVVSAYSPTSLIWNCSSWNRSTGGCNSIDPNNPPNATLMSGQLTDGQIVYAVEVFYKFDMVFGGFAIGDLAMPTIGPNLYSMTVF